VGFHTGTSLRRVTESANMGLQRIWAPS
jgi:hypothetical protein